MEVRRRQASLRWDVIEGELVPNSDEQAAIEDMLAMHHASTSYRDTGRHVELPPMTSHGHSWHHVRRRRDVFHLQFASDRELEMETLATTSSSLQ